MKHLLLLLLTGQMTSSFTKTKSTTHVECVVTVLSTRKQVQSFGFGRNVASPINLSSMYSAYSLKRDARAVHGSANIPLTTTSRMLRYVRPVVVAKSSLPFGGSRACALRSAAHVLIAPPRALGLLSSSSRVASPRPFLYCPSTARARRRR
jgi:hypothetical protein